MTHIAEHYAEKCNVQDLVANEDVTDGGIQHADP